MPFFNSYSQEVNISSKQANLHLQSLTYSHKHIFNIDKSRLKLFKGWIKNDQFKLRLPYLSETVAVHGSIVSMSKGNIRIHVSGKFRWLNLIFNLAVLLIVSSTLLFLSFLMIEQNAFYGLIGLLSSLLISWGLYRNLIGKPKRSYKQMSDTIIGLLSTIKLNGSENLTS